MGWARRAGNMLMYTFRPSTVAVYGKRQTPGQQLIENHAQTIEIAAYINIALSTSCMFWGHIGRSDPANRDIYALAYRIRLAGQAKSAQFAPAVRLDK